MPRSWIRATAALTCTGLFALATPMLADNPHSDFGAWVQKQLNDHAEELFGFTHPLDRSALGRYDGPDNTAAIEVAQGLRVSLVSSVTASAADQIALWPNDEHPTHLFVCDEETSNPSVQRIDLSKPADANVTTIVTGLSSCDPVRRTPWGTIVVAEEAGATGGLYELIDPVNVSTPIAVTNRTTGATSDPRLVKRMAVGSLAFEGLAIRPEGTMIFADELAPSNGAAGGGIYKFVPAMAFAGAGPIALASQSPFVSGDIYGLRVAASGSSNYGQGAETGNGAWTKVNQAAPGVVDASGNVILRTAQALQKFTGYYRPEDMDVDPVAAAHGQFRACWANTGRKSHNDSSLVENSGVQSEIMCLVENPPSAAVPAPPTGTIPVVDRFLTGSEDRAMYDNVAFQPHTGNLVVLEDGPVETVTKLNPLTSERRGNDLFICLPDGSDPDGLSDGCVRFASIRDTSAEPTGFIFFGSGEEALVNIQHRAFNDGIDPGHRGALVRISGFKIREQRDHDDH